MGIKLKNHKKKKQGTDEENQWLNKDTNFIFCYFCMKLCEIISTCSKRKDSTLQSCIIINIIEGAEAPRPRTIVSFSMVIVAYGFL